MAWSNDRTTIVSAITTANSNYSLIPGNEEPETTAATLNHLYYSLKLIGVGTVNEHSSNIISFSHQVMLKTIYVGVDSTIRITNEGLFITLIKQIGKTGSFVGFVNDPTIEDLDDKHLMGTIEFLFGEDNTS